MGDTNQKADDNMNTKPNMDLIEKILNHDPVLRDKFERCHRALIKCPRKELAWLVIEKDIINIAAEAELEKKTQQASENALATLMELMLFGPPKHPVPLEQPEEGSYQHVEPPGGGSKPTYQHDSGVRHTSPRTKLITLLRRH